MKVVTKEKKGFKRTEVGVIPEDWVLGKVGEVVDMDPENLSSTTNPVYNFDYVSLEDVSRGIIKSKTKIQFADSPSRARRILRIGDVGFGTVRPTNQSHFLINKKVSDLICSTGFAVLRPHRRDINSEYLFYLLFSDKVNQQITQIIAGSNYPAVNSRDVKKLRIPIPPTLEEQQAIADALSDVDELIRSLDALIQKKEAIKKGTMQQILTPSRSGQAGNKRLPGFDGEWEVKRLGDVGEIVTGGTPSTTNKEFWNGHIPWITPTDITQSKNINTSERLISDQGLKQIRRLPNDSLLITCIASIGKNAILRETGACNQQINAIITDNNHDVDFLYYLIEQNKQVLLSNSGKTATVILSKKKFSEIDFSLPKIKEQKAIAQILSDMDEELQALRRKREKMVGVKEGMMQELLTGKTRLV
jgi:type I restriction enzyme S subunit